MILRFGARRHYDGVRLLSSRGAMLYMNNCSYMQTSTSVRRQDTATVQALADLFSILGDPTRVRIVDVLAEGELCVCDIAAEVGISESAVSHQLRLMRGMRIVRGRREGRSVYYSLDDQHVLDLFQQGLRHVSEERR